MSDSINGVNSSITQTASQIRSEVSDSINGVNSSITQTASQIRSEVVGKDGVISAINQTAEQITIQASKINLSGYVTTSSLNSVDAKIDNLTSGTTKASYIKTAQFLISDNYFTLDGNNARWKSYTARYCSLSGEHTFKDTGGTSYTGRLVTAYTDTTLYYVGRTA